MSRRLHIDPVAGVSGDMLLGALVDAGASLDDVRGQLQRLAIDDWSITSERVTRHGLTGTLVSVRTGDTAHHRGASELLRIVRSAGLSDRVTSRASSIIERIAAVEAAIHAVPVDDVHFHEVGALDTIIDIVGVCVALDLLDVEGVSCSPLPTGAGTVVTAHGELPVPAPATLALIAGTRLEWRFTDDPIEVVTPTGAAIVAELAEPATGTVMSVDAIGYGFGSSTALVRANCCRVAIGESAKRSLETVVRLSTTIDDQSPESLAVVIDDLQQSGVLDVWSSPVVMKKGRIGTEITVLCHAGDERRIVDHLFVHTSTLGIRREDLQRHVAERVVATVDVDGHQVRVKIRHRGSAVVGAKPELDDCRSAAREIGVPVEEIRERAIAATESLLSGPCQVISGNAVGVTYDT